MSRSERPTSETVGQRIRRLRLERELSQRELSAPGISYAYISRVEAGQRQPSVKALRMLAKKLGVTTEYLESGTDLSSRERREIRLAELELALRLDGAPDETALDDILAEALADADPVAASRARIALGFSSATRGEHAETIRQLEAALRTHHSDPSSRPDIYATLGRAYAAAGEPLRAVQLFRTVLDELQELAPADAAARIRFSSYLSFALTDAGRLDEANDVVRAALSDAADLDPYTRVRLHWARGRLSMERNEPLAALDSFRSAMALLELTDDTAHLARAHLNCTQALLDAGDLDAAADHFEHAEQLLGSHSTNHDLAELHWLEAMISARRGDHEETERIVTAGLELTEHLPNGQAQLWWALGEARAAAGLPSAEAAYQQALPLITQHGTVRERTNFLDSYAGYLDALDRHAEARDLRSHASSSSA